MKRRINKKAVITLLCSTSLIGILSTGYTLSPKGFEHKLSKAGLNISSDAVYGGYNDEGMMKSFSFVDAGNYNDKICDESIDLLNDKSKPTGVIITTGAKDFCEIYREIDYTKDLVRAYAIEYPICLNINNIFYSNSINEKEVNELVDAYVKKAQANGLTVYVVGDDYVMNTIVALNKQELENRVNYPIGLLWDYKVDKITLDYDLVISKNYIYSNKSFDTSTKLNSAETFVDDFVYTIDEKTSFSSLTEEMGMPGEEIKRYNCLSEYDRHDNQKITIPSKYHKPYLVGVDISSYQKDIDFDTLVGEGVQFAIQRAGYSTYDEEEKEYVIDTYFNHYSTELYRRGIIQGAYYYSTAINHEEMDKEIELFLRTVEGHDITLPLYIDIEGDTLKRLDSKDTRNTELALIDYYCDKIIEAGYTPGIYIHMNYNKYIELFKDRAAIWNCGGYYYNVKQDINNMYMTQLLEDGVTVFQNTKKGNGSELGAESEYICLDYADFDFVKTKKMN